MGKNASNIRVSAMAMQASSLGSRFRGRGVRTASYRGMAWSSRFFPIIQATPPLVQQNKVAPPFGQRNFYFTGYFLKLSFRDTLRLNTRWSAVQSRLSMQK